MGYVNCLSAYRSTRLSSFWCLPVECPWGLWAYEDENGNLLINNMWLQEEGILIDDGLVVNGLVVKDLFSRLKTSLFCSCSSYR